MNWYNEEVVVKTLDGTTLGECRVVARVLFKSSGGKTAWQGELRAVPGKSLDFVFNALGMTVQFECEDGASAEVVIDKYSVGTSTNQCTFGGTGSPPHST